MKELIKVIVNNDQQLVSARELYKGLELKKDSQYGQIKTFPSLKKDRTIHTYLKVRLFKSVMEQLGKLMTTP